MRMIEPKGCLQQALQSVWLITLVLLLILQLLATNVAAKSPEDFSDSLSDEEVVENFLKIAFGLEGAAIPEEAFRLFRWESDLNIAVAPGITPKETEILTAHLDDLARLIGLAHRFESVPLDANVILRIGPLEELLLDLDALSNAYAKWDSQESWAPGPVIPNPIPMLRQVIVREHDAGRFQRICLVNVFWSRGEFRAYVGIHNGLTLDQFRHCVVEEFTQMLGLMNDDDTVRPSIFNDRNEFDSLTKQDEWLLQLLYDPVMEGGMTKAEAKRVAQSVISHYRK